MDGFEATRRVREYLYQRDQPQPIISAVTGHVEQTYIDMAIKEGMNQVLSKPVFAILLKDLIMSMGFPLNKI
jgi:CheY-like chemotaxis protein